MGEIGIWIHNALGNSTYYSRVANFGLIPIFDYFCDELPIWSFALTIRLTDLIAIVFCLAACYTARRYLATVLLGVGMAFFCHHDYGLVYLLPAFAYWLAEGEPDRADVINRAFCAAEGTLWFVIFTSLGCVFSPAVLWIGSDFRNAAIIVLGLMAFVRVFQSGLEKLPRRGELRGGLCLRRALTPQFG